MIIIVLYLHTIVPFSIIHKINIEMIILIADVIFLRLILF